MLVVAGKLWCCQERTVTVLNPVSLVIEYEFEAETEERQVHLAASSDSCSVWVAGMHTLELRLYHATKFNVLAEVNIRQFVCQKLSGLDELIRVHKLSCLKITCIHVCKDTLWIGTSAGLLINLKIPHLTNTTTKINTNLTLNGKHQTRKISTWTAA